LPSPTLPVTLAHNCLQYFRPANIDVSVYVIFA